MGSVDSEQGIQLAVPTPASKVFRNATDSSQRCNQFNGPFHGNSFTVVKGAIKTVPPLTQRDGFYLTYFLIPK